MTFFWATLIGGVFGAAIGAGITLAAQWRETKWDDED